MSTNAELRALISDKPITRAQMAAEVDRLYTEIQRLVNPSHLGDFDQEERRYLQSVCYLLTGLAGKLRKRP